VRGDPGKIEGGTAVKETLSVAPAVTAQEAVLPGRVQEALSELVGAAKEGLLALSVATGLGVLADGIKVPLGLWDGSTENKTVAAHLLSDLVHRGLDVEQGVQAIGCASCRDTSPTSKAKGSRPPDEPGVSGRSSTLCKALPRPTASRRWGSKSAAAPDRKLWLSMRASPEEAVTRLIELLDDVDPAWRSFVKV
jgi:hypothetical protein